MRKIEFLIKFPPENPTLTADFKLLSGGRNYGTKKKQRLMDLVTQKISEEVKKFLETLFLLEREFFVKKGKMWEMAFTKGP